MAKTKPPIIELSPFQLSKRQPDPPHIARVIAERAVSNKHGVQTIFKVKQNRKDTEWWVSASTDYGWRACNTLHTANKDKAKTWIDAVESGRIKCGEDE